MPLLTVKRFGATINTRNLDKGRRRGFALLYMKKPQRVPGAWSNYGPFAINSRPLNLINAEPLSENECTCRVHHGFHGHAWFDGSHPFVVDSEPEETMLRVFLQLVLHVQFASAANLIFLSGLGFKVVFFLF